jgi:hypothetical protein
VCVPTRLACLGGWLLLVCNVRLCVGEWWPIVAVEGGWGWCCFLSEYQVSHTLRFTCRPSTCYLALDIAEQAVGHLGSSIRPCAG